MEELLIHEGSHGQFDNQIYGTNGWSDAVSKDPAFISVYARDNPNREDVAESLVPWMFVRQFVDLTSMPFDTTNVPDISDGKNQNYRTLVDTVITAIPHRLVYLENNFANDV